MGSKWWERNEQVRAPLVQPPVRWVPPSSVAEFEMRYLPEGEHLLPWQAQYVDKILTAENYVCVTNGGRRAGRTYVRSAIMRMLEDVETFGKE